MQQPRVSSGIRCRTKITEPTRLEPTAAVEDGDSEWSEVEEEVAEDPNAADPFQAGRSREENPACLPCTREEELGARYYCVWRGPLGQASFAGVHWGVGLTAYNQLVGRNNNKVGGLGWKRCSTLEGAQLLYRQHQAAQDLPREIRYFHWL